MIFHLLAGSDWLEARGLGEVRPPSLATEGFVHLSTAAQVPGVVARFYAGATDLVVLAVDPDRLADDLRWEAPAHAHPDAEERFPHLYGPVPVSAVVAAEPLATWVPPEG